MKRRPGVSNHEPEISGKQSRPQHSDPESPIPDSSDDPVIKRVREFISDFDKHRWGYDPAGRLIELVEKLELFIDDFEQQNERDENEQQRDTRDT